MILSRRRFLRATSVLSAPFILRSSPAIAFHRGQAPFDVFLIAGQSNAVGNGVGYTDAFDGPSGYVYQWPLIGTKPIPATEQLQGSDYTGPSDQFVGFAMTFAKTYVANGRLTSGHQGVLLVPAAVDATGFASGFDGVNITFGGGWVVGNSLAVQAKTVANLAMAYNSQNTFKGFLWLEGENEISFFTSVTGSALTTATNTYTAKLDALIADLRANITGASTAPFILGQMTQPAIAIANAHPDAYGTIVNNVNSGAPGRNTKCAFWQGAPSLVDGVDTNPSGQNGGNVHYCAGADVNHGQHFNGTVCYNAYVSVA